MEGAILDLLVIGGGIHGVAVARDAALRGLSVLLAERGDLANATSSRTSKLIHGGIRYLEQGRIHLVRESLRERALLLRLAPAFVRPVTFLLPTYRGAGRPAWMLR
ncbi:MAG TPA: FAD-dependent oxidoreductase, partial [Acidobacteriota bacterium]|nr:FAD-dependent oxidoreductase [Acidobacteriota bacterium]